MRRGRFPLLLLVAAACGPAPSFDPDYPPAMHPFAFDSGGVKLSGIVYVANGPGPHPTAVLLHGFPGNERNLDLAQGLRTAGINSVFFHYRGSWGMPGEYTVGRAVDDAQALTAFLREPASAADWRIDPERTALVGHSFGAFIGALAAAADPQVDCLVFIAGMDLGGWGRAADADAQARAALIAGLAAPFATDGGPLRGDPAALVDELIARQADFDLYGRVERLAPRPLLAIAGERDTAVPRAANHDPFVAALRAAGAPPTERLYDDDHAFSAHRAALIDDVTGWLGDNCWSGGE